MMSWLDIDEIKSIILSFNHISGLPVCVYSMDGMPLIPKIGGTTYCDILVAQKSSVYSLCEKCRLYAARECLNLKRGTHYYCHMGLIEITAPIMINGQMIAYMSTGMVFDKPPVEREIRLYAARYGMDPDFLWEAAQKVPIKSQSIIERSEEGLYNYASILSASADSRLRTFRAQEEVEKAAQMKNDFLANMSHEIRTPMNAVIGMAELASNEEISPAAKEYLDNIQSSGKTLLHIINDILDYSKISSGKMSIFEDRYNTASLIRDVSSIIVNRLREKQESVFFYVDVDPALPAYLIGDMSRISQIIINIANNAVKFTKSGFIRISYECSDKTENGITLKVTVKDTGIGIKNEDKEKLFNSFSQVDSRRNRNVEGTGLGLAIVKQLVSLMNGTVGLDSVYGSGSTFYFEIPQKADNSTNICGIPDPQKIMFLMDIEDDNILTSFHEDCDKLGLLPMTIDFSEISKSAITNWVYDHKGHSNYLILDEKAIKMGALEKADIDFFEYDDLKLIIITKAYSDDIKTMIPECAKILKCPITTISVAAIIQSFTEEEKAEEPVKPHIYKFTAPTAKVLVVDDIPMNLKLAERLLARMEVKAVLASSGQEALDLLSDNDYDIIFMDHMMPGLDGIDTTRLIRRFHSRLNDTPIIALTANVMEDAKKMFLSEGMSDIIPKPIEVKTLTEKLLKWLPQEKIVPEE